MITDKGRGRRRVKSCWSLFLSWCISGCNEQGGCEMKELSLGARRLRAVAVSILLTVVVVFVYRRDQSTAAPSVSDVESGSAAEPSFWVKHSFVHPKISVDRYVPSVFVGPGAPISAIKRHHYGVKIVPLPTSFQQESLRVALWDHSDIPVAVFSGPPGFTDLSRKDFIAWVSSGKNAVFLGGYSNIVSMNQIFGFELEYVPHEPGPYWQNARNVPGTPFQYGPSRLAETTPFYGVALDSLPLSGYSMYDAGQTSVVFFIKYNLGTVCYVGAQFGEASLADPLGTVLRAAIRM